MGILGMRSGKWFSRRRKEKQALRGSFVAENVFHGFIAVARRSFMPGPCNQARNGAASRGLVARASGQKGAIIPCFSEPRRVDTKPLTTDALLLAWGARQVI
jgi:hypothetical protein